MVAPPASPSRDLVARLLARNFRLVMWPHIGDAKGPREKGWPEKTYTIDDYVEGHRVGILTGHEVAPGKFLHDYDIDWAPGALIAQALLPPTNFIYGRASKRISHCFYTTSEPLASIRWEDPTDRTCLLELRGTKLDGTLGMQSMAPPSVWTKDGKREALTFVRESEIQHIDEPKRVVRHGTMGAIGMLLGKHFGKHGFGHEARLAWAGFLLRAGLSVDELVAMGEALSEHCSNLEIKDVRLVVESTMKKMAQDDATKKIKAGPALAKLLGDKGKAIVKCINNWLGVDSDFVRNSDGAIIRDSQQNIRHALTLLGVDISFNEFSDKMILNRDRDPRPIEDREMTDLWLRLDEELHFRPSYAFFEKVVYRIGWLNGFHPVRDYLATLEWDGVPRIDSWLITSANADDCEYVRAVSAIVLIAAVKRIRHPGCKYDEMLVLESKQGLQKSSALRALCPNPQWFSDDFALNLDSQKMIEATLGKWIIEASELSGMRASQVELLKSNVSRQTDGPARMAYAHIPIERQRQFILIGTTNSAAYLADPTGARRFWPMAVGKFDIAWIAKNRDQLWAEAAHREAAGESNRLKESLWAEAAKHQEKRREVDPWEHIVRKMLHETDELHDYPDRHTRVTTAAIYESLCIPPERRERRGSIRISEIMQRMGFNRTRVRLPGEAPQVGYISAVRDWTKYEGSADELQDDVHELNKRKDGDEDIPF